MFSTSGKVLLRGVAGEHRSLHARNRMAFRLGLQRRRMIGGLFESYRSGRLEIEKRSYWRSLL